MRIQWLRNLPVSRKFIVAFGIFCCLSILLGGYTFSVFRGIAQQNFDVSENAFPSVINLADVRGQMNVIRRQDLDLLLCATAACTSGHLAERQKAIDGYHTKLKAYEPEISYPGERELYQKFSSAFDQYMESSDHAVAMLGAGKNGEALDILSSDTTIGLMNSTLAGLTEDMTLNATMGMESARNATSSSRRAIWVNCGLTLLIVLLSIVIGLVLTREIAPRVAKLKGFVEAMADKDLSA